MSSKSMRVRLASGLLAAAFGFLAVFHGGAGTAFSQWCPSPCVCDAVFNPSFSYDDCVAQAYIFVHSRLDGCCELVDEDGLPTICDAPEPCFFNFTAGAAAHAGDDCVFRAFEGNVEVHKSEGSIVMNWQQYPECGEIRWFFITANGNVIIRIQIVCVLCPGG